MFLCVPQSLQPTVGLTESCLLSMVEGPGVLEGAVESYFRQGKRLPKELLGVRLLFGAEMNIMNEEGELDLSSEVIGLLDVPAAGLHRPPINTMAE